MENEVNIEKIIEKSKQWTLEGDCTLLQWMNQISNNLEERVTKTSLAINQMSTKLDRTSVALCNVTNNLAALQYSKFVENRVHDDDETLVNTAKVPSADDINATNHSSQDIYTFLRKNVEMMNSCHEAYSISYEDSEDDDDDDPVTSVVYRSKNPYENRPLPHIYGSNLWKEKWHIGLCDSDNDFSGEENSEQFSESSSTAGDSCESTAPTMSEWDSTAWGLNTQNNLERKDMHTPSNDGESSYQGEDFSQSKVSTPRAQRSMNIAQQQQQQPIQDPRYYTHVPRRQESQVDDIFADDSKTPQVATPQIVPTQKVVSASQKKIPSESYIPNEPPPDVQSIDGESNRRVGAQKTLNLFDDDEFSSFMDQIVQKATNKNNKTSEQPPESADQPKKAVSANIFIDQVPPDDDGQKQTKKDPIPNIFDDSNANKQSNTTKTLPSNIFSDTDDLFTPPPSEKIQESAKKIAPNLFNDSDDIFTPSINDQASTASKKNLPSPKLEDDIFKTTSSPQSSAVIVKTKITNLFDDDDEDDDFDNIFSPKPSTSKNFTQVTKNLFSDDFNTTPEINKATEEHSKTINDIPTPSTVLFSDDKNSGALDNDKTNASPAMSGTPIVKKSDLNDGDFKSPIMEKEGSAATSALKEEKINKKGLFEDFDDLEDENDIFASKPSKKDSFEDMFKKGKPDDKTLIGQSKSLFGDDSEGEMEKEDTEEVESKQPETAEEIEKHKTSDSTNELGVVNSALIKEPTVSDVEPPSSSVKKTQFSDIFAEPGADDFEDFVPTNSSKLNKEDLKVTKSTVNQTETEVLPITVTSGNPKKPTSSPGNTQKPPIVAQKPFVDKMSPPILPQKPLVDKLSKPQIKTVSKQNPKADFPVQQETKQISTHLRDLSSAGIPQIQETNSNLDKNKSELSEDLATQKEEIKPIKSSIRPENIQTKIILKADEESSKPILKQKPKIVIEQKISSPSKDTTDGNLLGTQSTKRSSTIPSYTSLFHDDVPPEDENPNPTSNEESPLHTVEEDVEVKPISSAPSVPYSSINLFADVPPDDYFSVSIPSPTSSTAKEQTKRIHSIFYDDFHETIEAGREMRTPSSYMINDEPPPDDKDNKPIVSEIKKEKPQVSKLKKMNLQINVGALLPSAKMPSFKKPPTVDKSQSDNKVNEQNTHSTESTMSKDAAPIDASATKSRDLPENILPNLNKDRAKFQVKRRPSTRLGRQERYRKSMIEESDMIVDEDEDEDDIDTFKPLLKTGAPPMNKTRNDSDGQTKTSRISLPLEKNFGDALNKMPDQTTLFEESDNFFNKKVISSSSSEATTTKIPSLFKNSDSEPENIFESIKSNKSNTTTNSGQYPATGSKNLDSLFDSDDGISENPFGTPKNFLPQSTTAKETMNKLPEEKTKLDLLFESVQPKESNKDQSNKSAFKSSGDQSKTTSKSLFGDSDESGSDDLFKGSSVATKKGVAHKQPEQKQQTKSSTIKQSKQSSSLFSSDEGSGSGDDIFGKAKVKTVTKKQGPSKDKVASSLFADMSDDDSDNLFGTPSSKKSSEVNKPQTNPPKNRVESTTQAARSQQANKINSNPLSDLLGP